MAILHRVWAHFTDAFPLAAVGRAPGAGDDTSDEEDARKRYYIASALQSEWPNPFALGS